MTSSVAEPRKKLQSTFQSQTCTKKRVVVTVWWSAAGLIHYSFLNPGETITSEKCAQLINEMHWNLQCLQPALVNRKGPILLHDNAQPHFTQPTLQKLNELGYKVLPHLPYSPGVSPNDSHFFKHLDKVFARKMLLQPAGGRKWFPRVHQILKQGFLCYRNKQTFLVGKNVLLVMAPILINKDVFEPS